VAIVPAPRRSVQNYKMNITKNPETGEIKYTYMMRPGISKVKGAILILQEMNYPEEIINEMRKKKPKCVVKSSS
jgi:DNA mismatch repair ATPase MutS